METPCECGWCDADFTATEQGLASLLCPSCRAEFERKTDRELLFAVLTASLLAAKWVRQELNMWDARRSLDRALERR